jgi:RimJ/RimL family protein N-acetyltransferase
MADLEDVQWPPDPIETTRLRLRPAIERDREGYIELLSSEEVRRHLGGPNPREEAERQTPELPANSPGEFAVEVDGEFVGTVTLNRRNPDRPGHIREQGNEVEVSYTFLPARWGNGYATEAVDAALRWVEKALPGEPVVLCTQASNHASMRLAARLGFVEHGRFVEFDAVQWFGARMA